ncbi:putative transcriptional regulator [Bradyrhizobium sp. USDA 4011]
MTKKEEKRLGRPIKPAAKGTRVSLGLKVRPEVKKKIDEAAQKSGRTQSQEAEALIEHALAPYFMLEAMRATLAEIEKGNIEAAFRKAGYVKVRTRYGDGWLPPGYPLPRSGFIEQEDK